MDGSNGETYWRERAEQLQRALISRVVIEQAKGILAERLSLDVEGAFALLRYAARGARLKLHDLALAVVSDEETPEEIVKAFARHTSSLARVPRAERIVQTAKFFRAINDEIAKLDGDAPTSFVCECGNPSCMQSIQLPLSVLRRLHEQTDTFVVLKGHELLDGETVVDRSDGYLIIRKTERAPAD